MNCIKKTMGCVAAAVAVTVASAAPVVSNVSMSQTTGGRLVTVTYNLSEDAVVTLDVMTNTTPNAATGWASIGGEAICNARGAVWRKVTSADADGEGKYVITWRPDLSWAGEQGKGFKVPDGCAKAVVTAWSLDNTPNYMVVDISDGALPNTQRYYPAADFIPGGLLGRPEYRTTMLVMRKIMAKDVTWTMGSTPLETARSANEATHEVTLDNNYYIGVFEVTQGQWASIKTDNPYPAFYTNYVDRAMRPVESVSYCQIRLVSGDSPVNTATADTTYYWPADPNPDSFLGKLNNKTGLDFDLPSEAQWEFAARAGNGDTKWGDGSGITGGNPDVNLNQIACYNRSSYGGKSWGSDAAKNWTAEQGGTPIVGSYEPNDWGLYDMSGSLYEYCNDFYQEDISALNGAINTTSGTTGTQWKTAGNRVMRGGTFTSVAGSCRPAYRSGDPQTNTIANRGFRVACTAGLQ